LFAQSSWRGLQPGTATRAQLERVAGAPVQTLTESLIEYQGEQPGQRAFVQYRAGMVERIEVILGSPMASATARSLLQLGSPDESKQNARGKTEEYYAARMMVLTLGGGGVERYAYYSRELFEATGVRASAAVSPMAPEVKPQTQGSSESRLPPAVGSTTPTAAGTLQPRPTPPANVGAGPGASFPASITIPAATKVKIYLGEKLTTAKNKVGDKFTGTLAEDIVIDDEASGIKGEVVAVKGGKVEGRIASLSQTGRVQGVGEMHLELTSVEVYGATMIAISTGSFVQKGEKSLGSDAKKAGGATAVGAAIGAVAGGGKGAAIGAGAGAAVALGAILITRGKPAELNVETMIEFQLGLPVTVNRRRPQ
jgi:hypothetical protein